MIELVIIGERFYKESQTSMSAIYRENPQGTFHRYDWGFMQLDMLAGKQLHVRPATKEELEFFRNRSQRKSCKVRIPEGPELTGFRS
jgi:hypothetical protein